MKKKTTPTNHIAVISGVQKHPVRYKLWKFFSRTGVKRATITLVVVVLIFVAGTLVYANRIAVTNAIYAAVGLDLDRLAAELAGAGAQADGYVIANPEVSETDQAIVDEVTREAANQLPDDVVVGYLIEPETSTASMVPTVGVSEAEIQEMNVAAQIDPDDNYEEEVYGGYDDY